MKKTIFFFLFCLCATFGFAQKTNVVVGVSVAYQGGDTESYGYNYFLSERSTAFSLGYQLGKYLEFGGTVAVNVKKYNSVFDDKKNGYIKEKTILHSAGFYLRGYYPLTNRILFFVQPSISSKNGKKTGDGSLTYIDGHQETEIEGRGFRLQPGIQFKVGNALRIEVLMSGSTRSKLNYELTVSTNKNDPIGAKYSEDNVLHNYSLSELHLAVSWLF